jgi:hypothetical protein
VSTFFWIMIAGVAVVALGLGVFALALCKISKSDEDLMP